MITKLLNYLGDLRSETELLESLNWDGELLAKFHDELTAMLMAAPPNVEKALFWLQNTPWECFDDQPIPDDVWPSVYRLIKSAEKSIHSEMTQEHNQITALPYYKSNPDDESEWN